jgi:hypothetical protein
MNSTLVVTPTRALEDAVNDAFCDVEPGFVNAHNEPAMTTPAVAIVSVQTLVVGSTVCLIC